MKHSIYVKFIIIYIVAAILCFVFVAEGTSKLIMNHMTADKAATLYQEAVLLSTNYAEDYYRSQTASSFETVHSHFSALDTYLNARIWLIDIDGTVILDSEEKLTGLENTAHFIEKFDPTSFGTSYYMTGDFFGEFDEEVLSVISPINYNLRVRGYLVIHTEMDELYAEKEHMLNIVYITLAVLLLISLISLLFVGLILYYPMKKIMKAASEYAAGNLSYQVELNTEDEFGRLAGSMNLMAKELNDMERYKEDLSFEIRNLEKNIETEHQILENTIAQTVKSRREEIEKAYNTEIEKLVGKDRKIKGQREKAKEKGVIDRIAEETKPVYEENAKIRGEIANIMKKNKL